MTHAKDFRPRMENDTHIAFRNVPGGHSLSGGWQPVTGRQVASQCPGCSSWELRQVSINLSATSK